MTIYKGDCLELMRTIPDGFVDMVLTDPTYSSGGMYRSDRSKSTGEKYADKKFNGLSRFEDFTGDNMDQRSFTSFMRQVLSHARRLTKPGGAVAIFTDWRQLPLMTDVLQWSGWVWRGIIVWDKGSSRNQPGRFRPDCEFIIWGTNGPKPIDFHAGLKALPGCYHIPNVPNLQKHHQTEKPIELLEKLLQICPEGGTVLDPFMGSGSTGVACIKMGRDFVGIEISEQYNAIAKERIFEAMKHSPGGDE